MKKSISFYIDEDIKAWLAKEADKAERSTSRHLNSILRGLMGKKK